MSKWEMVCLGEIGSFKSGGTPPRSESKLFKGNIPWITTVSLGDIIINADKACEFLTQEAVEKSATKIIKPNSIMIGIRVGVGKCSINTVPMCTNQDIISIENIDDNRFYKPYIIYLLKSKENYFADNKRGATIQGINSEILKSILIPTPPVNIQKQIAATLDNATEHINLRKQRLAELDNLIKSVFYDMFGDPMVNDRKWDIKRLDNIVKIKSSKRVYQREQTMDGVPFLRVSDLVNRITDNVNTCDLYISEELYDDFLKSKLVPKAGDILVTSRGTLGLCYIVKEADKFYFQDGMISWLDKQKQDINSFYLAYLFHSNSIKQQIDKVSTGSTVNYLSLASLGSFKILYPPLELQNRFANFMQIINNIKTEVKKTIEESQILFDSLMSQYFE